MLEPKKRMNPWLVVMIVLVVLITVAVSSLALILLYFETHNIMFVLLNIPILLVVIRIFGFINPREEPVKEEPVKEES